MGVDTNGAQSTEQAIGQWLDESLNSITDNMVEVTAKDGQTDVSVGSTTNVDKAISGKSLSKEDLAAIETAAKRPGGGTGLYTKTHKGEWVGTHTMEGMLVTAKANQELTNATNILSKDLELDSGLKKVIKDTIVNKMA